MYPLSWYTFNIVIFNMHDFHLLQCWIILLSACADNGDVDLAAAIHRFLLSRNGPLSRQVVSDFVG